ncbi:hypothetical protein GC105_11235 [Alkalibaculum sp. M08DMB]|uniref:Uncharacterized protein n=1 Tax=Alkalibaculum sporogenes TaxID=2655001 RepID=A0A6A7KAP9_9FIRM|nr:hypothetical protein [Alkalibaculum sporogenes]
MISIYTENIKSNFDELIVLELYGSGTGIFSMRSYIYIMLYNIIPVYILCGFYEYCKTHINLAVKIRFGSRTKWLNKINKTAINFIILYIFVTILVYIITSFVFTRDIELNKNSVELLKGTPMVNTPIINIIIKFVISKFLEMLFIFLFILLIDTFTKSTIIDFILIVIGHIINLFPLKFMVYNPMGISFLGRQIYNENARTLTYSEIIITLFIYIFFVLVILNLRKSMIFND